MKPGGLWVRRTVSVLVVWATLSLVTIWLQMRPDLPALGAVAFAVAAIAWFVADSSDLIAGTTFQEEQLTRRRPIQHGRLGMLRRLSEDAGRRTKAGGAPPGALSFQEVLRTITERRVAARLGHDPSEDEVRQIAGPELASYLMNPAPPALRTDAQHRLIDRIEAL